jgi:hypothetical protein
MAGISRWVFRSVALWAAGKAWQKYQDRKTPGSGTTRR